MRRRAPDFRRPVRRGFMSWIWRLLLILFLTGVTIFIVPFNRKNSIPDPRTAIGRPKREAFDSIRELSSATSLAHQLVDQMTLAKAYLVLVKDQGTPKLAEDLASQIRNSQRLLSLAAVGERRISLEEAQPMIENLAHLILRAQRSHFDIATNLMKLKNGIQALESRVNAGTAQTVEFSNLIAESLPGYIHCLTVKLTVEEPEIDKPLFILDQRLHHFCVFSDNLLAASVVVNSTVLNADNPQKFAFHVVTDSVNFKAMKAWLGMNSFRGCSVEVRSVEEFSRLKNFSGSSLRYLRFYIPEMFPSLEKIVFLDDDVVVQRDLAPLFSLDLKGNVNGAVETCLEGFHRYYRYFNFSDPEIGSRFGPQTCGWAFGVNVFDLAAWRKADLTENYHYWKEKNSNGVLWRSSGTLAPGLLVFYGRTESLDRRWHVLGLGFDPDIDSRRIESAAVVHFSGRMKPWQKTSIASFSQIWISSSFPRENSPAAEPVRNYQGK